MAIARGVTGTEAAAGGCWVTGVPGWGCGATVTIATEGGATGRRCSLTGASVGIMAGGDAGAVAAMGAAGIGATGATEANVAGMLTGCEGAGATAEAFGAGAVTGTVRLVGPDVVVDAGAAGSWAGAKAAGGLGKDSDAAGAGSGRLGASDRIEPAGTLVGCAGRAGDVTVAGGLALAVGRCAGGGGAAGVTGAWTRICDGESVGTSVNATGLNSNSVAPSSACSASNRI